MNAPQRPGPPGNTDKRRPRKPKLLDAAGLFDYAARALSGRALTQGELRTRLRARAQDASDVEGVIARLKQYGYVDDRRFAENYSRLRRENQGFGKYRVLRDLKQRRVAPALAEKAVAEAYHDTDEARLIEQFLRRKLRYSGAPPKLDDPRKLASLHRMLLRAGFTSGKILEALRKLAAQDQWVEDLEAATEQEAPD
ncbi:MAG TPA: regulatory protein RecX [Bryobacterales bacterium]|nr:regulatory protein RecX [Bryobacterales bacterium]